MFWFWAVWQTAAYGWGLGTPTAKEAFPVESHWPRGRPQTPYSLDHSVTEVKLAQGWGIGEIPGQKLSETRIRGSCHVPSSSRAAGWCGCLIENKMNEFCLFNNKSPQLEEKCNEMSIWIKLENYTLLFFFSFKKAPSCVCSLKDPLKVFSSLHCKHDAFIWLTKNWIWRKL